MELCDSSVAPPQPSVAVMSLLPGFFRGLGGFATVPCLALFAGCGDTCESVFHYFFLDGREREDAAPSCCPLRTHGCH